MKVFNGGAEPVALQRSVTVQDLLRHSSGMTYSFAGARAKEIADAYKQNDVETFTQDLSPDEVLKRVASIPLAFQPGTTFEYGISTDILGILLERVTGKRLDVLVEEMVLVPLKMSDTGFTVPEAKKARLADAFDRDPMKAGCGAGRAWKMIRVRACASGGAGMVSTADDYFRFAQMLLNGGELNGVRLLSAKTVEYMLADHIVGMAGSPAGNCRSGLSVRSRLCGAHATRNGRDARQRRRCKLVRDRRHGIHDRSQGRNCRRDHGAGADVSRACPEPVQESDLLHRREVRLFFYSLPGSSSHRSTEKCHVEWIESQTSDARRCCRRVLRPLSR